MPELSIANIASTNDRLSAEIIQTPLLNWPQKSAQHRFGNNTQVVTKLEMLQHTGSFKARAALLAVQHLNPSQLERGVTAVSAGNHAAAVAWAAARAGTTAKVVMPSASNPYRVSLCRDYGAEVTLVKDVHAAFEQVRLIEAEEGRFFIHPFAGETVALATATIGYEFHQQLSAQGQAIDAMIIAVGGGGLCAGVSSAIRLLAPDCEIFAVEPYGADSMYQSFRAGSPQKIDKVDTLADSLGAPHAEAYSFSLCKKHVERIVRVSDEEILQSLYYVFQDLKLAIEPAAAAAMAALAGPLQKPLAGRRVGMIICGANIDAESYQRYLHTGADLASA
ncbi:MAG: pyridoxal-phosphate dependent enzyme [Xanthomonadales bacterium]|nr:pyridoxal-phosphate dependent enzyme [Xanthomonadales bacterium]